jgi:hypothetical protein
MMNLLKFEHGANFEPTSKENNISSNCEASNEEGFSIMQKAKKTAVAISGGALVAIGIPLIPLPGKIDAAVIEFSPLFAYKLTSSFILQ